MQHTVTKGTQSNYQITMTLTKDQMGTYKVKALQTLQKDIKEPGFRPGNVPLDIVEKKIRPDYLEMAIYEEVLHAGTHQLLETNKDIKFIGTIYDLNKEEKDETVVFTFKLDEYPQVDVKNDKRKKLTIEAIDPEATQEEINDTLMNLKKQYANYLPADTISGESLFKAVAVYKDKDGNQTDKKSLFIGKEEMTEFPVLVQWFADKKVNDVVTLDYTEKKFPDIAKSQQPNAATVEFTINDIRTVELPEFTPENIKKFFGNDDVETEEQLRIKIAELIKQQKEETLLMKAVDDMLNQAREYISVIIPKTLIDEEVKTRMKSLQERMGGEKGLQEYFAKMGDEQKTKMIEDITNAAKLSLEKFFLLQKLTELLEIKELNREKTLDVERKIYETLEKKKK